MRLNHLKPSPHPRSTEQSPAAERAGAAAALPLHSLCAPAQRPFSDPPISYSSSLPQAFHLLFTPLRILVFTPTFLDLMMQSGRLPLTPSAGSQALIFEGVSSSPFLKH